ncbi:hypothetical protein EXM65_13080 [Clostridium botulinum]|uniref:Uncharacterized protein n=1 Tax=Clostridium botulinum TaxID=1491 RepID=A0A6M0SQ91_CLOBO|nr:hypothetical protein [Clostridium botulinum]
MKIKFIDNLFVGMCECVAKDTVMNLKENVDHFKIYSDNGYVVGRFAYDLKDDIYKYFKKIN